MTRWSASLRGQSTGALGASPAGCDAALAAAQQAATREMTKADIADMRHWHAEAVRRSLRAEYDIVYVYAGHAIGGLHHFLSRRYNNRTDEYGGSIENRARLDRKSVV